MLHYLLAFVFLLPLPAGAYPLVLYHTVAIPKRERNPENYFGAKAFLSEPRELRGKTVEVLVQKHVIPLGSKVSFQMEKDLTFWPYLTDWGMIVGHSKPYFKTKVLEIPPGANLKPGEREELLSKEFYVNTFDLAPDRIVALRLPGKLPAGVEKSSHLLPWDDWNPAGNWAWAIERALANTKNSYLVNDPPADISYFCPKFPQLKAKQRVHFWQTLLNETSWRESSFVPFTFSDEGKYTVGSEGILSTGLMQLSIASVKSACYQDRGCNVIRSQQDLFDPEKNLTCGIGVISCLVSAGKCISCKKENGGWLGAARYWSVLREKHTRDCPTCFGGKVSLGKKEELLEALKKSAAFCFD